MRGVWYLLHGASHNFVLGAQRYADDLARRWCQLNSEKRMSTLPPDKSRVTAIVQEVLPKFGVAFAIDDDQTT